MAQALESSPRHRLFPGATGSRRFAAEPTVDRAGAWALALALSLALAGCGSEDASGASVWSTSDGSAGPGGGGSGAYDAGAGGVAGDENGEPLPNETEKEVDFGAPEGSPNFVFIPVEGEDRVVKVSGKTQAVTLVEVGDRPTVARAVPGTDAIVVISAGSDELALVRSTETADEVSYAAITPHCNAIAVSPDGAWAVVYYDHSLAKAGDPVGSFQSVSVVPIGAKLGAPRTLSIGFRPSAVHFTADGARAMVITADGVCVITLADAVDGAVVPPVPVAKDPLDKPAEREVQTTPDGTWALVRQSGLKGLFAIHLPTKKLVEVALSSVPTDLDLTPKGDVAMAVLRDSAELAFVDLPSAATLSLPTQVLSMAPLVAGLARITSDGKTAILYSSVGGIESVAAVDMATRKGAFVPLRKTIDYVWLAPGATTAVLVHKAAPGPLYGQDPTEKFVDDSHGYTLYDWTTGYTKLVLTPVAPVGIAASKQPSKAWILLPDPKNIAHEVQSAGLQTLLVTTHPIGSRPQFVRPLDAAGVMAVSQKHPSGRMTFFDAATGTAKTVTGYELNGLVK